MHLKPRGFRIVVCLLILVLSVPSSLHATEPAQWISTFTRILQDWGVLWSDEETGEAGPHVDPHGNTLVGTSEAASAGVSMSLEAGAAQNPDR